MNFCANQYVVAAIYNLHSPHATIYTSKSNSQHCKHYMFSTAHKPNQPQQNNTSTPLFSNPTFNNPSPFNNLSQQQSQPALFSQQTSNAFPNNTASQPVNNVSFNNQQPVFFFYPMNQQVQFGANQQTANQIKAFNDQVQNAFVVNPQQMHQIQQQLQQTQQNNTNTLPSNPNANNNNNGLFAGSQNKAPQNGLFGQNQTSIGASPPFPQPQQTNLNNTNNIFGQGSQQYKPTTNNGLFGGGNNQASNNIFSGNNNTNNTSLGNQVTTNSFLQVNPPVSNINNPLGIPQTQTQAQPSSNNGVFTPFNQPQPQPQQQQTQPQPFSNIFAPQSSNTNPSFNQNPSNVVSTWGSPMQTNMILGNQKSSLKGFKCKNAKLDSKHLIRCIVAQDQYIGTCKQEIKISSIRNGQYQPSSQQLPSFLYAEPPIQPAALFSQPSQSQQPSQPLQPSQPSQSSFQPFQQSQPAKASLFVSQPIKSSFFDGHQPKPQSQPLSLFNQQPQSALNGQSQPFSPQQSQPQPVAQLYAQQPQPFPNQQAQQQSFFCSPQQQSQQTQFQQQPSLFNPQNQLTTQPQYENFSQQNQQIQQNQQNQQYQHNQQNQQQLLFAPNQSNSIFSSTTPYFNNEPIDPSSLFRQPQNPVPPLFGPQFTQNFNQPQFTPVQGETYNNLIQFQKPLFPNQISIYQSAMETNMQAVMHQLLSYLINKFPVNVSGNPAYSMLQQLKSLTIRYQIFMRMYPLWTNIGNQLFNEVFTILVNEAIDKTGLTHLFSKPSIQQQPYERALREARQERQRLQRSLRIQQSYIQTLEVKRTPSFSDKQAFCSKQTTERSYVSQFYYKEPKVRQTPPQYQPIESYETQQIQGQKSQQKLQFKPQEKPQQKPYILLSIGNFKTSPSYSKLLFYDESQLSQVHHFRIWNDFGSVQFLEPVSLVRVDFTSVFIISQDSIEINDRVLQKKRVMLMFKNFGGYLQKDHAKRKILKRKAKDWIMKHQMRVHAHSSRTGDLYVEPKIK